MDLETFEWLLTPAGRHLLDTAAEVYADHRGDPVRAATALRSRRDEAPALTSAALTQTHLRVKAVPKFGPAAVEMFFTTDGLEQATRTRVAQHRASRLVAAGVDSIIDLGCGIGGDLLAFAAAGLTAAGVEADPLRVAIARANLAANGLPGAVARADATTVDVTGFGAVFADPARRGGRGRVLDAEGWTPPWPFVAALLGAAPECNGHIPADSRSPKGVVKVAPGIPHSLVPNGVEAEWVSEAGEVKEAALWSPALATCRRRATVIGTAGLATLTEQDDPYDHEPRPVRRLGGYLYEPDGAVIRAGLVTAVAAEVGGGLLDEHIAYVTADEPQILPFARGYQVLEQLPYREKQLKAALRQRGVGILTIKKRGVDIEPSALRKRLALRGPNAATLVLTRREGAGLALLVNPL